VIQAAYEAIAVSAQMAIATLRTEHRLRFVPYLSLELGEDCFVCTDRRVLHKRVVSVARLYVAKRGVPTA
jgi:hypothetical protein